MDKVAVKVEIKPEVIPPLSEPEQREFQNRCQIIAESVNQRNKATSVIVAQVDFILQKSLWRGEYNSEEEFIRAVLNLEKASCMRYIKAHRMFLYLSQRTDDAEEIATLSMMRENAYRELRRIATGGEKLLKSGAETNEDFQKRLEDKEASDLESVFELWSWMYPKIKFHKIETRTGLLPGGNGFSVTEGDIIASAKVLHDISQGMEESRIEVDGKHLSMQEIEEAGGDVAPEVLDALATLAVSTNLTENLQRHRQHIRDSYEKQYVWDKFEGTFEYENGKFIIKTPLTKIDFLREIADLMGKEAAISIRREDSIL